MPSTSESAPGHTCLACVASGEPRAVVAVAGEDDLAERLRASGLWSDAVVEVVGRAPFGDPLLVQVHGFRIALRRSEAARVTLKAVGSDA